MARSLHRECVEKTRRRWPLAALGVAFVCTWSWQLAGEAQGQTGPSNSGTSSSSGPNSSTSSSSGPSSTSSSGTVTSGSGPSTSSSSANSGNVQPQTAVTSLSTTVVPKEAEDPTASRIGLADAVHLALGTAPRLRQAEAQRNAQIEHRRSAWADVGPRVSSDYNQVHFSDPLTASLGPGATFLIRPQTTKSASITVSQPITGAYALVERAHYEGVQEEVREQALQLTRADVAYEAVDTWLKAYAAQRQLEILEAEVKAAQGQARDGEAMEHAGRLNHADTLRLELQVSEAKSNVAQARAARDTVLAALHERLGLPVGAPVALQGELPTLPPPPGTTDAVNRALSERLEPKQAQNGVAAAGFGKKIAYAQYTPNLNVFAKSEKDIGPIPFGSERFTHTIGIQATWELWANGSTTFALREAGLNVIAAEEAQRNVEQLIRIDVQQALANYAAAVEGLTAAKEAVAQANEAYRIEQVRFRAGSVSSSDLLLVQTAQTTAQGRLVAAQTDVVAWNFKTQKALGLQQPQL